VDGSDVNVLYDFLLKVIRIVQVGQLTAPTIYELLYPCYSGATLDLFMQAISAKHSFDIFHVRLLKQLIPARQLSQLFVERYEWVQADVESLACYIQSIRGVTLVLRISETEAQIVERIVEGLTPLQRDRIVFQGPPTNFKHLKLLIVI
jgi:hypothetical protein